MTKDAVFKEFHVILLCAHVDIIEEGTHISTSADGVEEQEGLWVCGDVGIQRGGF